VHGSVNVARRDRIVGSRDTCAGKTSHLDLRRLKQPAEITPEQVEGLLRTVAQELRTHVSSGRGAHICYVAHLPLARARWGRTGLCTITSLRTQVQLYQVPVDSAVHPYMAHEAVDAEAGWLLTGSSMRSSWLCGGRRAAARRAKAEGFGQLLSLANCFTSPAVWRRN
jgi:hypothetical protein